MNVHYYSQSSSLVYFWNIIPFLKENRFMFVLLLKVYITDLLEQEVCATIHPNPYSSWEGFQRRKLAQYLGELRSSRTISAA